MLTNYQIVPEGGNVAAVIAAHTCPLDGYVYAWQDPNNPNLVYFLPTCPADTVVALLQTNVGNFVNVRWNYSDQIDDPHMRVLDIIDKVMVDARGWLDEHTYTSIAEHLGSSERLSQYIFNAMVTQLILE